MSKEYSLVLIKPDAIKRNLTGLVLTKMEEVQLKLIAAKLVQTPLSLAEEHYAQHKGKPFYPELIEYITGKLHGPPPERVLALVYEGENAISVIRALAGHTNPEKAEPNTIRGMFGRVTTQGRFENVIHASANPIEGEREIKLWFKPEEIIGEIFPTKKEGPQKAWKSIPSLEELPA
jgi:nucleoside-diphosphate kinase